MFYRTGAKNEGESVDTFTILYTLNQFLFVCKVILEEFARALLSQILVHVLLYFLYLIFGLGKIIYSKTGCFL